MLETSTAAQDAFCAIALLLGASVEQVEEALPQRKPLWLAKYKSALGRQGRATQLAPRLLALQIAIKQSRVQWG